MEIKLTYEEIQEIRKGLLKQLNAIDINDQEDRYHFVSKLYDRIVSIEEQLEEEK